MPKKAKKLSKEVPPVRACANVKSRKHPDVRCPCPATQGDFCARHSKHPVRFQERTPLIKALSSPGPLDHDASAKIQTIWRGYRIRRRIQFQGIGSVLPHIAQNTSDVYTLEPLEQIPLLYRWSYTDSKKNTWLFDIRSLAMMFKEGNELQNPYTREILSDSAVTSYKNRLGWLRKRKYCILHIQEEQMTPEQLWHQRILDVFLNLDLLGYHTCLNWFEEMSVIQLYRFYYELWDLWFYRVGLTEQQKSAICPQWRDPIKSVFRVQLRDALARKELKWHQTLALDCIEALTTRAVEKENRTLGALYVMTALSLASPKVREHYSWLAQEP